MRTMSRQPPAIRALAGLAALLVLAPAAPALAAPTTVQVEGVLLSAGGAPAADGTYKATFRLHSDQTGGSELWSEGPVDVVVAAGRLAVVLGATKPLDAAALAGTAHWLGVTIGADPELPRRRLHAVPFAVRAGTAEAIACSGCVPAGAIGFPYAGSATKGGPAADVACSACVSVAELKFDGDVDLGGNSLKAGSATFSGDVVAKTVTATALVGDGSKLTGLKLPSGACKAGEAMVGIASDGAVQCKPVADALPADGLDEVSGGLLTNQFDDVIGGPVAVAIPDNTGANAVLDLAYPSLGIAQALSVQVELSNTDLATIALKLLPPNDKKTGLVLCDPCGGKDQKSLNTSFPDKTKVKAGDLAAFVGQALVGSWTLVVTDSGFCAKNAPGNAALCDVDKKTDGQVLRFQISAKTLSDKKVAASGDVVVGKDVQVKGDVVLDGQGVQRRFQGATQLYTVTPPRWSYQVGADPNKMTRIGDYAIEIEAAGPSLLTITANGHVSSPDSGNTWIYADVAIDGVDTTYSDYGQYHTYRSVTAGAWAPFAYTTMAMVDAGSHLVELRGRTSGGAFYYNGGTMQVAVVPSWKDPSTGSKANPGRSCAAIKAMRPEAKNGVYWIDPDGPGTAAAHEVYCEQESWGGGWTLLMKSNGDCTFQYSAEHWTKATTLSPASPSVADGNAKYAAYNELKVTELRARFPSINHDMTFSNAAPQTALKTFATSRDLGWGSYGDTAYNVTHFARQAGYHQYGVDLSCNASVPVRWGWMFNNEGDCASNDVSAGIGMNCWGGKIGVGSAAGCCSDNGWDSKTAAYPVLIFGR